MRQSDYEIWLPGRWPDLNDFIAAAKSGKGGSNGYSRLKKKWTDYYAKIINECDIPKMEAVSIDLALQDKDMRRDPDNIEAGAKKLVLDALIKSSVIINDGWKQVRIGVTVFSTNKRNPGVKVFIDDASPAQKNKKIKK